MIRYVEVNFKNVLRLGPGVSLGEAAVAPAAMGAMGPQVGERLSRGWPARSLSAGFSARCARRCSDCGRKVWPRFYHRIQTIRSALGQRFGRTMASWVDPLGGRPLGARPLAPS